MTVSELASLAGQNSPPSSSHQSEKHTATVSSARGDVLEVVPRLHAKTYLAVFTVCLIYYAQLVNLVGAGAQTQAIASALDGSSRSIWISSPLAILTVVLSPIASQAADYWGRRWILVGLTAMGAIGSIIVARATSMNMVIAGFTISGFSYGAQPLLHTVASEVVPRRYRSWAQAADLCANALGGITALLVGGALNRDSNPMSQSFRNFWYMATAIFGVAAVLTIFLYNPPPTKKQMSFSTLDKVKKLDWVGYFLFTSGLVLFSVGLSWSENPYPWSDAHTSATLAVGLVLGLLLCVYEAFFKKDGMFHHGLFGNRNFPLILACIFCEGIAFFAANQYFAFEVGILYESDNLIVGAWYGIAMIVSIFSALAAGFYCALTRRVRWITVLAFVIFVAFFVGMATSGVGDKTKVWGFPVLLGASLGMTLCSLITAAQLSTPPELIAITSGLVISIRSFGGAVGLAVYNAIFTSKMNHLGANVADVVLPMGLNPKYLGAFVGALTSRNNAALLRIPGATPQMAGAAAEAMLKTYASGFQAVWIAAGCFVALATIFAIFLKDPRDQFNMQIDAPIEKDIELFSLHSQP